MKQSPKLKPTFWDGLVVLAVAALAVLTFSLTCRSGGEGGALTVVVTADSVEVDRFASADLLKAHRSYTCNGVTLTVAANGSGVHVESSDCPTQDCVHTGVISKSGQSIVCLPGRIVIRLVGGTAEKNAVDAVIG